jgi:hypothetical protein
MIFNTQYFVIISEMILTFIQLLIFSILNKETYETDLSSQKSNSILIKKYNSVQTRQAKEELIFNSFYSTRKLKKNGSDLSSSEIFKKNLLNDIVLIDQNYRDNIQLSQQLYDCKLKLSTIKNELSLFDLDSLLNKKDIKNITNEFHPNNYKFFQLFSSIKLNEELYVNYQNDLDLLFDLNNEFLNSSNLIVNKKLSSSLVHRRIKSIKKKLSELLK